MKNSLEKILFEKDKRKYKHYKMVKLLLMFTSQNNNFTVDEKKSLKFIDYFFENNRSTFSAEDFIDELFLFFYKVVIFYEEDSIEKFNFILEKESIAPPIKEWLKENREKIFNIFKYYYKDIQFEQREDIVFNHFFSITKITKDKSNEFFVPNINIEDINIRILLKGKVYYSNGIFLKEGEYLITDYNFQLNKYKVLSDDFLMLIITISKEFISLFGIKEMKKVVQIPSTIHINDFIKFLDKNILKENFLFFLDIIILMLKGNNLLDDRVLSYSEIFCKDDFDICDLIDMIDDNIILAEEELRGMLLEKFSTTEKKLDDFIYEGYKLTLRKYIIKQKIKFILADYFENPHQNLQTLLEKYNYSNMKNFRYNLRNFYNLAIRDLSRF